VTHRPSLGLIGLLAFAVPAGAVSQLPIAFTHVTVIDGSDSIARPDLTIVVRGARIESVGPGRTARIPPGARVVEGRGKFLLPGFWDMHVHAAIAGGRELLKLYLANGVTGVRDMAGDWDTLRTWREDIAAGRMPGPRILASGPYLEGGDVPIAHFLTRTPDEGRVGVDSLVRLGVDFVKVHSQLNPATYFAIARRARERGIPFAGHVSRAVGAEAASDSGQRSIEHLLALPVPCTPADSLALLPRYPVQGALGRCSSHDLAPLYARFVRNGTWMTPTFTAMVEVANWPERAVPGDSLARYVPESVRRFVAEIFPMPEGVPPGADSVGRAILAKRLEQVGAMRRAGVRILTGTDAPLRNSPPGFGLHEEFVMLRRAGLSPFEIIQATTLEPARYFGMLDSTGTIAPGMRADLVLLAANPLRDIRNTRRILAVVAAGRLYEARDLARPLP
jgi:imidazolonepropionase-like amidohydrolase